MLFFAPAYPFCPCDGWLDAVERGTASPGELGFGVTPWSHGSKIIDG